MLVQNNGNFVHAFKGVSIAPGVMELPDKLWNEFKEHPINKILVEEGTIVASETDDGEPISFSQLNQGDAIAKVKDTFNPSLLESFEQEEKDGKNRKGVISAIAEQQKLIEDELKSTKEDK